MLEQFLSKLMGFAWSIYFSFPPFVRLRLKYLIKGNSGHEVGRFSGPIATRDAKGKCHLYSALGSLIKYFRAAGITSIEGLACLEIGTGYVGSTPLCLWIFGAKSVVSVDLNPIRVDSAIRHALDKVEIDKVFQMVKDFVSSESELKCRLNLLNTIINGDRLKSHDLYQYCAPFDLLSNETVSKYDLILSVSVLEHLPPAILGEFITEMSKLTVNGRGIGLHFIDLSDHYDHHLNPLGFLSSNSSKYNTDADYDSRGNRCRASNWIKLFNDNGFVAKVDESQTVDSSKIPADIDDIFVGIGVEDLTTVSILLSVKKC